MKGKKLAYFHNEYISNNCLEQLYINPIDTHGIVYGHDEFKFNFKKKRNKTRWAWQY